MKIFICGAVSSYDDPFEWMDDLEASDEYGNHEFTNAYQQSDVQNPYDNPDAVMEPAIDAVRDSDGLLVRWEDDVFLPGAVMYMTIAHQEGIPIVVWYEGSRDDLQIPLEYVKKYSTSDLDKSVQILRGLMGDSDAIR